MTCPKCSFTLDYINVDGVSLEYDSGSGEYCRWNSIIKDYEIAELPRETRCPKCASPIEIDTIEELWECGDGCCTEWSYAREVSLID